ncbi:hypothetical protein CC80DRAFT_494048 [Byssothecium circinans]|uniref:F-box domain-containing protein n=1 Tax=Byssothecium circinans TaxID=147558 RepID=A0A6A5TR89_9PLEO|nr:hypothetical protein CC80DRAFT_494048 [Byssothecium circinans]
MPTSSATQTLTTPELLELILTHLPLRSILTTVQRVCKAWHTLIQTSPTLQTKLYFRASLAPSNPPDPPNPFTPSPPFTLNPLITSSFPFLLTPNRVLTGSEREAWRQNLNGGAPTMWDTNGQGALDKCMKMFLCSEWALPGRAERWKRKEASWRKMYVSQPAVRRVVVRESRDGTAWAVREVVLRFGGARGTWDGEGVRRGWIVQNGKALDMEKEEGLKMGPLYDYLYTSHCTGDIPGRCDIIFLPKWPIDWTESLANDHSQPAGVDLEDFSKLRDDELDERHKDSAWRENGYSQGVTLFLSLGTRTWGEDEEEKYETYEQFRSDALGKKRVSAGGKGREEDEQVFVASDVLRFKMRD